MRLIDRPNEYHAIAPLVVHEIVYRLLTGPQASRMRHLAMFGGHAHRMVRAVEKLRENDAAEAGYRLGYDDTSHFSRDYKRHFGEPPMRDAARMREV